jgi:WD40 repeat protein
VVYSVYMAQSAWLYDAADPDSEPYVLEGRAVFSQDGDLYIVRSLSLQRLETERLEIEPGTLLEKLPPGATVLTNQLGGLVFSPDGTLLASPWADNRVVVWDVHTGQQVLSDTAGYGIEVSSLNFNADGSLLVATTDYGWVGVWNVDTGELIAERRDHFNVAWADFSPVENLLVTTSVDRSVTLWNAENGDDYTFIDAHTDVVYAFFTPDGSRLIVADATFFEYSRSRLRVWDVEKRSQIAEHDLEDTSICSNCPGVVNLSPTGNILVFWTRNPDILLVDVESGDLLYELEGDAASVNGAAFSPNGRLLASWDEAGQLRFWDVETGDMLLTLETKPIRDALFTPDGTGFITAHADGTIQRWGIAPPEAG